MGKLYSGALMSKPLRQYLGNQLLKSRRRCSGDKPAGGLMRMLEQEQSAERASKSRRYSGGHYAE